MRFQEDSNQDSDKKIKAHSCGWICIWENETNSGGLGSSKLLARIVENRTEKANKEKSDG
jgi:hypothetical protein